MAEEIDINVPEPCEPTGVDAPEQLCKCHNLRLTQGLRCTPLMIEQCEVEDGAKCDGLGRTVVK